ncbi:diguanylate cyclase [Actinoplanes sp. NPDC051343]|uniref:diguanylate cyclase n=1 Tax=Actinoplanes sp. NPDC051343 TaxID=3363906 RepID=UPI0037B95543
MTTLLGLAEVLGLAEALTELESLRHSEFRDLAGPAAAIQARAQELGLDDEAQRALLLIGTAALREGRIGEGGQIAQRVRSWAEQHDHPLLLARAHRELSIFYRLVGDLSDALTHGVHCLQYLPESAPPTIRIRHLVTLAVALDGSGSVEEGDRRSREALALSKAIGDHEQTLLILNNMAYTAFEVGDEPGARDLTDQMREVSARTGEPLTANELDTIARVDMMSGRYGRVEQVLAPVLTERALPHESDAIAECLLTLAEARRLDGRFAAAQDVLTLAVRQSEDRGLAQVRSRVRQEQAALYAAAGRFEEAYEEHRIYHASSTALLNTQRDARARALQAVFEATEARRTSEHFREMAHRDALTGLHNRRFVNERLPVLLGEAAAQGTPLAVALVDLDHFKRVNDTLSHATGDEVLQIIGELLQQATTGSDVAARMGGEEFLLIFPGASPAEAAERCERLRLRVRAYAWGPVTGSLPVTTSIGVTTVTGAGPTSSTVLSRADDNLYAAKRAGRDRVVADGAPDARPDRGQALSG